MPLESTHTVFFQVNSDLNDLELVLSKFETVKQSWVPSKCWLECQLALAEAFTNTVRHAHQHKPIDTPIDIEICIQAQAITIKIWDYGEPFDLDNAIDLKKSIPENPLELSVGGRGLMIMDRVADTLTYDRLDDDRNCLNFYKKFVSC